jgi:hypothetical protein
MVKLLTITGTGSAIVNTPAMAHNAPIIIPCCLYKDIFAKCYFAWCHLCVSKERKREEVETEKIFVTHSNASQAQKKLTVNRMMISKENQALHTLSM